MDKKYGVYICEGCGIGEALDIEGLKRSGRMKKGCPSKPSDFCAAKRRCRFSEKGHAEGGINTLVMCACSRRVNFDVFRFDGCIVDRVNLREGVVWSHPRSEVSGPDRRGKRGRG
jgi:quinone-modifying oxidoreductase subunit QmoB